MDTILEDYFFLVPILFFFGTWLAAHIFIQAKLPEGQEQNRHHVNEIDKLTREKRGFVRTLFFYFFVVPMVYYSGTLIFLFFNGARDYPPETREIVEGVLFGLIFIKVFLSIFRRVYVGKKLRLLKTRHKKELDKFGDTVLLGENTAQSSSDAVDTHHDGRAVLSAAHVKQAEYYRWSMISVLFAGMGLVWFAFSYWQEEWLVSPSFLTSLLLIWIFFTILSRCRGRYQGHVKSLFIQDLSAYFGVEHEKEADINIKDYDLPSLKRSFSKKNYDDSFQGQVDGRTFSFQEFDLKHTYKSNGPTGKKYTQGVLFTVALKRNLEFRTYVIRRNKSGKIPSYAQSHIKDLKEIDLLASSDLQKFYAVYSGDELESRVIFDPAFMERFAALLNVLPPGHMEALFEKNRLIVASYQDKDHFEIEAGLFKRFKPTTLEPLYRELDSFAKIVELLDLNPHTGL